MLFDTHCHLSHPTLQCQLPEVLAAAAQQNISRFLVPATSSDDWQAVIALHAPYIHIALGIHPWFVSAHTEHALDKLATSLQAQPQALVGEIGLDFHPTRLHNATAQIAYFEAQLQLAQSLQRPIVLHNFKADAACLDSIRRCGFTQGGFAHAFSGSLELTKSWLKLGFKIGIGSVLLKTNAQKIRRLATELDWGDMVLETDAPFMSPTAKALNTPQNTRQIAEIIASLRQSHWQTVAHHTTQNALAIVGKLVP